MKTYKTDLVDIRGLRCGAPPVGILPKSLTGLWKDEPLPRWLVTECNFPATATIATLSGDYWKSQDHIPPRVQHFAEFLIKNRMRAIESVRCIDRAWPVGLEAADIPFGVRGTNALKGAGLLEDKEALSEATFGQLLRIPSLGIKSLLEITTLIDAALELHWRTTVEIAKSFSAPTDDEASRGGSMTSMAIGERSAEYQVPDERWSGMTEVLREPWADQIDEHDPRFFRLLPPGYGTVEERIERAVSDPASASVDAAALVDSLPKIRAAVDRLNAQPLEENLLELLRCYIGDDQARLNALAARLGWSGDHPKTLQQCGDALGITRERVRQIEAKVLRRITNRSIYLPKLDAGLAVLEASTPLSVRQAAELLAEKGISRRPFSPISLLETARLLGRKTTLGVEEHKGEHVVVSGEQGEVLGILARAARKLAGQSGVASVYQVIDRVRELHEPLDPPDIDEEGARKILRNLEGCEFLDEDWFWLTTLPEGRNRLENITKKILSVASPQSVASIREGVRRAFRWRSSTNERYRSLTVPPQGVLARFLERHPDFVLRGELVTSVRPLDYRKLLGEGEQTLVDVLRGVSSGVVDRRTLIQECLSRGINENTLAIYTTYSPILEHIGIGLWQLRGVRVDPAAVEAVREQNALRPRETRMQDFGWFPDGKLWVAWALPQLTGSPVFGIPSAIRRYLAGRSFSAKSKEAERAVGKIAVTDDGASYGYAPFLRYAGADKGDVLCAEFDLLSSDVRLSINDDRVLEDV